MGSVFWVYGSWKDVTGEGLHSVGLRAPAPWRITHLEVDLSQCQTLCQFWMFRDCWADPMCCFLTGSLSLR